MIVPSAFSAISPCMWKSRANPVEIRFSVRSSTHFTGRPSSSEAAVATTYPGYTGTLLPNPPPMSGRDDPDVLLGKSRHQREHRADRVRRLRRHVDRRLAGPGVDVRHARARLERRRVAARVERVQRDDLVGRGERLVGALLVARLPVVDVVVGLAFLVVADDRRAGLQRLLRRRDRREHLVVDVDQLERVFRDVGVLGDDGRDLLALEAHLVGDQHGLRVIGERRHPCQVVLRHELAGDHRDHAR